MNNNLELQTPDMSVRVEWVFKSEKTFNIRVVGWNSNGKWNWNVYANIYESHPMFTNNSAMLSLPFNGGCTLDKLTTSVPLLGIQYDWQRETKIVTVGSDYNHIHDDYDNHPSPFLGIPNQIEHDAQELYEALTNYPSNELEDLL